MLKPITPNDKEIIGLTDTASIQNAINHARLTGQNRIVIPRLNERTGACHWDIGAAILIPSDMTIVLDNCYLRMENDVICNMFRNMNAKQPQGRTIEGRQQNITICGQGQAVLDGGEPNCLNEFSACCDGLPHISENLLIYLHNVEHFKIENITVKNQRWYGMAFMFACNGHISDINFVLDRHSIDTHAKWRNQDGIDLRVGCYDITIENIHGESGDDFIALNALANPNFEIAERVEGANRDIHDILIRNIHAITNLCSIIRLLNHFGQRIYNITMRDIFDISRRGQTSKPQMAIRIGDDHYFRNRPDDRAKPGDLFNIIIENLHTRALSAIITVVSVKNLIARDIFVERDGGYVWSGGVFHGSKVFLYHPSRNDELEAVTYEPGKDFDSTYIENVIIENVYYTAEGKRTPALFGFNNCHMKNIKIKNINNNCGMPVLSFYNMEKSHIEID